MTTPGTATRSPRRVVVLGTGGTIAGLGATPADDLGYRAAQVPVARLVAQLGDVEATVETEQVAQLDSKDIDFDTWHRLANRVDHHLARAEVVGVVVTHGTDTMEDTAYFLQRVLAPAKPVVLTGAMRPASSSGADGPRNLADALATVFDPAAHGVLATFAGHVHAGARLRKVHPTRLNAFSSGERGALATIASGRLQWLQQVPAGDAFGLAGLGLDATRWPIVEIVVSVAGTSGLAVDALAAAGVRGIVVAATGNGTLHHLLEARLVEAARRGVAVLRALRCGDGAIEPGGAAAQTDAFASAGALTPVQARIELMLRLLADDAAQAASPTR